MKGYLYIEGKLSEISNNPIADQTFAGVADGVELLREGFHKLFEKELPELKINIIIEMGGPWTLTLKKLASKEEEIMKASLALVDYQDLSGDSRTGKVEWALTYLLEKGIVMNDAQKKICKENIFFMIQQMEGWFLSQPEVIEECLKKYKSTKDLLMSDLKLTGIHPSAIKKPADVLGVLLGRYFEREKGKKMKYHKVKHATIFLQNLDTTKLKADFQEFANLINVMMKIESK